jgi:hypothetical protein
VEGAVAPMTVTGPESRTGRPPLALLGWGNAYGDARFDARVIGARFGAQNDRFLIAEVNR